MERCHGTVAAHRLMPLPSPPDLPNARPISGRSFSPNLPAEVLSGIQSGTLRYRYRDRALLKSPLDLSLYLLLLGKLRPRTVIEIGTFEGGSALWFADMLTTLAIDGRVVTLDRQAPRPVEDHRITEITGMQLASGWFSTIVSGKPASPLAGNRRLRAHFRNESRYPVVL